MSLHCSDVHATQPAVCCRSRYIGSLEIHRVAPTYEPEQAALMIQTQYRMRRARVRVRRKLATCWTRVYDESTVSEYYYNHVTGEAVWDPPALFGSVSYT